MSLGQQSSTNGTFFPSHTGWGGPKTIAQSSLAPTSTATRSNNNQSPSIQPPLILAFVALGVLTIAAALLFWSRRLRAMAWAGVAPPGGYTDGWNDHAARRRPKRPLIPSEVPKMWDLRAVAGEGTTEVAWAATSPLSAKPVTMSAPLSPSTKHPPISTRALQLRKDKPPPISSPSNASITSSSQPLQLSLAIIMPYQSRGNKLTSSSPVEFCIGQTRVSWHPPPSAANDETDADPTKSSTEFEEEDTYTTLPARDTRVRHRSAPLTYASVVMDSPAPT